MADPILDSPDKASPQALEFVDAAERDIRTRLASLSNTDALDGLELLRERLMTMELERTPSA